MMWRIVFFMCIFCTQVFVGYGFSATHYVRSGASGATNGIDWTNAFRDLPTELIRGDTYYIADGTYGAHTFNDAASGSLYIYIKKATASDHGTSSGWSDTYGDGEAVFTSSGMTWGVYGSYYSIDGQVGFGKSPGTYGFRVTSTASRASNTVLCDLSGSKYISLKHIDFDWNNGTETSQQACTRSLGSWSATSNIYIGYNYFHHSSGYGFYVGAYGGGTPQVNWVVEKNYFYELGGGGGVSAHWEMIWSTEPSNWDFRYNTVENIFGSTDAQTGWYMIGTGSNIRIYGNQFFCSDSNYCSVGGNGVIATWSNDVYVCRDIYIFNNTFADITGGYGPRINFIHNSVRDTNVVSKNNLYYNSKFSWDGVTTQSHEACGGGQGCSGTNQQTNLTKEIFTNYSGKNYRISSPTNAGDSTIGLTFNADADGRTRGADGVWDRGSFEFGSGNEKVINNGPEVPKSLKIVQ